MPGRGGPRRRRSLLVVFPPLLIGLRSSLVVVPDRFSVVGAFMARVKRYSLVSRWTCVRFSVLPDHVVILRTPRQRRWVHVRSPCASREAIARETVERAQ